MDKLVTRCDWAMKHALEEKYHDQFWGIPVHDDKQLFKMLLLEGQQAGLSWLTILKKMDTLCAAYDNFDPVKLAEYDEQKVAQLLADEGIIRNRQKVQAAIHNAKQYLKLCEQHQSLDRFLWSYVDFQPIQNNWSVITEVPARSELSDQISQDLKRLGFKFVGTTTMYAFMQAVGIVNDHLLTCSFREADRIV
ncbi:DNA-3-methyladenine glycosylase I [Paenibacillus yanchengensis]|uniref:DNA-3-methyladenine glycosylase I n=1 Tax=Paenibacillus yanchengensis TaxID=2035833 RepID=A0ABW4YPZ4_9BACL